MMNGTTSGGIAPFNSTQNQMQNTRMSRARNDYSPIKEAGVRGTSPTKNNDPQT